MSNEDRTHGLYEKYCVTRTDGQSQPGRKHEYCFHFVLDLTHDPFARIAALAYADACAERYPKLAAELTSAVHTHLWRDPKGAT